MNMCVCVFCLWLSMSGSLSIFSLSYGVSVFHFIQSCFEHYLFVSHCLSLDLWIQLFVYIQFECIRVCFASSIHLLHISKYMMIKNNNNATTTTKRKQQTTKTLRCILFFFIPILNGYKHTMYEYTPPHTYLLWFVVAFVFVFARCFVTYTIIYNTHTAYAL